MIVFRRNGERLLPKRKILFEFGVFIHTLFPFLLIILCRAVFRTFRSFFFLPAV